MRDGSPRRRISGKEEEKELNIGTRARGVYVRGTGARNNGRCGEDDELPVSASFHGHSVGDAIKCLRGAFKSMQRVSVIHLRTHAETQLQIYLFFLLPLLILIFFSVHMNLFSRREQNYARANAIYQIN